MKLLSVTKEHSTHTEIKQLYFRCNLKWWHGLVYCFFEVQTNYILKS